MTRECSIAPEPASIAGARRFVRDELSACADEETVAAVELVVSELVTNSVRHGPGDQPITLRLEVADDGTVNGEVLIRAMGISQFVSRTLVRPSVALA